MGRGAKGGEIGKAKDEAAPGASAERDDAKGSRRSAREDKRRVTALRSSRGASLPKKPRCGNGGQHLTWGCKGNPNTPEGSLRRFRFAPLGIFARRRFLVFGASLRLSFSGDVPFFVRLLRGILVYFSDPSARSGFLRHC